jgi:hypothetical protein
MAVTKFATRESLAGALLLSWALLAASPVLAEEPSLWDKMANTVGLGGNKPAPQPVAPQPAQAPQALQTAPQALQTAPQALQTAPQASQTAPAPAQAPQATLTAQPAAQSPSLWDKMANTVGLGGNKPAPQPAQASPTAPVPQAAQAAQPAAQSPGMFDNVLGKVGFGAKTDPTSIDYSERQKLAVPQTRDLPAPRPQPERQAAKSAGGGEALTKPPGEYLQKVTGQDGQVSGLRDGDTSKEKKFFGLF